MSIFLYYLPATTQPQVTRKLLADCGLSESLRDCLATPRDFVDQIIVAPLNANGPGEHQGGCIVAARPNGVELPQTVGYYPEEQEWRDCGKYWLGWWKDAKPTPAFLKRVEMLESNVAVLNGQEWLVPILREWVESSRNFGRTRLPQVMTKEAGIFRTRVRNQYLEIFDAGGKILDHLFSDTGYSYAEAYELSAKCLNAGYRVSHEELAALELISTDNHIAIYMAATNWKLVEEVTARHRDEDAKKNTPAMPHVDSTLGAVA